MSKSILETLFSSKARVKMLKLFFRNAGEVFTAEQIASRIQEGPKVVKKEISDLMEAGLIKMKKIIKNEN